MKLLSLLILLIPNLVFAELPTLNCQANMYQFKSDGKMFPLIGDTNQKLKFSFKDDGNERYVAEAQARFLNDQSKDRTNSLYGVKALATYSEGDGFYVSLGILKFDSKSEQAKFKMVGAVAAAGPPTKTLEENAKDLTFGYLNPKVFDPRVDLWTLMKSGSVKDYELYRISFEGCWIVK